MPDIIITPSSGLIDFFPVSTRVGRIEGSGNTINVLNPSGYVAISGSGMSINTSAPNALLHAYSSVSGATILNLEGTNGSLFSVVDNLSGSLMSVNNNAGLPVFEVFSDDRVIGGRFGQNDWIITSGGNIGIGTGVPNSKFHVVGTSTFNGDVSSTGSIIAGSGSASNPSFEFVGDVDTGMFSPAANTIALSTSGVERVRIATDGNVGIGTTTPSSQLHVIGSGIFSSGLFVGSTPVSISGHSHTSSDITNFNSSVSGLINGIYAPLNSPALIGVPTVPTASSGTNTTQIASTAFVRTEISNLVASAPSTLDTLNELATALGNDANFATTVTNNLAGKANLSGATFTGSISGPSGNFVSLKSNGIDVSLSGHNHSGVYADIATGDPTLSGNSIVDRAYALYDPVNDWPGLWVSDTSVYSSDPAVFDSFKINMGLSNAVTGSGTTNYLSKWNSSSVQGNSLIYDDGTNVGIGTISPIVKLEVAGDTYANNILSSGYLITNYILAINDFDGGSPGTINIGEFTSLNQVYWSIDQNGSGNFSTLSVNDVPVSLNGHTHSSSDITNFNSSVSGLLPTISNSGDNRILTSTGSTVGVTAESNLTFDGNLLNVTGSGLFASGLNLSNQTANTIAGFDSSKNLTSLSTATYPSLAELSYLKGATSSLQTQINSKQNTLTNPVTGTGVSNHIAYWNSSSGIVADSGQLVWNSTDNRLGIGTTTPSGQLHVVGTGLFSSGLGINTTNFNFFDIYNNNRNATVSVSGDVFIQNALYFYNPSEVDNRRRGLISSDGDAILNTLGVGEKADTLGNSVVMNTNGLVVNNAGGLGGSACQLLGDYGAIIENILIVNSNSNGNATVGIGTSTPSASLDVVGDVNIDGNLTFDSFTESVVANGNSGTSKTLSLASGTVHTCTLTGNCTFTMPTTTAGKSFTMFLNSGSGNYTASFSGVRWADSATPTATILANKVDIYSFISDGTYWYGSFSQNYG